MFSDNELRLKCLCSFQPGSLFRSPCMVPLCTAGVSEISLGGKIRKSCRPPTEVFTPCAPTSCSCLAWVVLEPRTVSNGFSSHTPVGRLYHLCKLCSGSCLVANQRWVRNQGDQVGVIPQVREHIFPEHCLLHDVFLKMHQLGSRLVS